MPAYETDYDANVLFDTIKDIIKKLPEPDQKKVEQFKSCLDQNNKGIENFLSVTTSQVEQLAADPSSPTDGRMWINTVGGLLKVQVNGVTKTVTLT